MKSLAPSPNDAPLLLRETGVLDGIESTPAEASTAGRNIGLVSQLIAIAERPPCGDIPPGKWGIWAGVDMQMDASLAIWIADGCVIKGVNDL